jgi:DNA-binding MarR family transcriptional regulator
MEKDASLSRELLELVSVVKRIVRGEFKTGEGAKTPTFTQYRMLHKIKSGVCHVGKLSEAFGISQPATSIMVNTMVKEGLLKRVPHPTDRRQIELHLTAKAAADLERGFARVFAKMDAKLASLSAQRTEAIRKDVRELARVLTEVEK